MGADEPREVVLVGGGHAHVQVLRAFAERPLPDSRLTVVVDTPVAVYSGMVPGYVAGQYRRRELEIDVRPLARLAGAGFIMARAVSVDAEQRRIVLEDQEPLPYHLASFNIGSTVLGLDLPGVRDYSLPTRPIGVFVQRVDEIVAKATAHDARKPFRVVVVGAGAGGVELAFALHERLRRVAGAPILVSMIDGGPRMLSGYPASLVRRVERLCAARGIEIRSNQRVAAAEAGSVRLADGDRMPCDALLWVTGPLSHPVFTASGLPADDRGFARVRCTLQLEGHDDLFAVGDCATLIEHPATPKAGVYAVREGPYIAHNLRASLTGAPLRVYRPQGDFLTLLNVGDGTALGAKWGRSFEGRWVMKLKDRIDRRFMRRFQMER